MLPTSNRIVRTRPDYQNVDWPSRVAYGPREMAWRVALVTGVGCIVLTAPVLTADDASPPDWKPTEITRVTVGADGGITLNGRVSTFGAFKIECKRLHRVDGALEYVRSTDGDDPRTARRVARIIVSTGVSVRFLGSDGEVPKDFQAAVPKVPL